MTDTDNAVGAAPHAIASVDQLAAAHWAAARGWHVFPADHPALPECAGVGRYHDPRACNLEGGKKRGKHPALAWGRAAARYGNDPDTIERWFGGDPRNVAIACKPSGLLVIDEDRPGAFKDFAQAHGEAIPPTFTVDTARGRHYYFTNPANLANAPGALKGHDIDVRGGGEGDGGYVIGPGSLHSTGAIYTSADPDAVVADCPPWLLEALGGVQPEAAPTAAPPEAAPNGLPLTHPVFTQPAGGGDYQAKPIPAGQRYHSLLSYAGRLRAAGLDYAEAEVLYRARWELCEQPAGDVRTWEESLPTLRDVFSRYEGPDLTAPPAGVWGGDPEGPAPDRLAQLRGLLVDSAGLESIPEPVPLLGEVLVRDSLAWLHGKPGSGKSFVALDWAGSVATGRGWHGHTVASPGRVVYLAAEGAGGMKRRVRAWEQTRGRRMAGVDFLPVAVQLLAPVDRYAFVELMKERTPDFVIIDTQARVTVGADENSAQDMGRLVDAADAIRSATGACVLLVHHEARSGDSLRGSTALEGAATTLIRATKDGTTVRIECTKQKDSEPFMAMLLRLVPHGEGAVLESHSGVGPAPGLSPSALRILAVMRDSFGTTGASKAELRDVVDVAKSSYYRCVSELVSVGLLKNTGTQRRAFYVLPGSAADEIPTKSQ